MPVADKPKDETRGQITDIILEKIINSYTDDMEWSVTPIIPMNGQIVVLNSKSETTKKAVVRFDGKHYIIKQIPWYCSDISFANFMLEFQNYLFKKGFKIPEIVKTKESNLFTVITNNIYYVQKFIIGEVYSDNIQQILHAGENLADMHRISNEYYKCLNDDTKDKYSENSIDLSADMVGVLNRLIESNLDRFTRKQIVSLTNYCKESTAFLQEIRSVLQDGILDEIQVHGDYNPYNLIFDNDGKIIATFDFENTSIDHPSHDIAEALLDFSFHKYKPYSTRFSDLSAGIDLNKASALLSSYCKHTIFDNDYICKNLPIFVSATFVELFSLGIVRGDYSFDLADGALKTMDTLYQDTKQLLGQSK
jgi:Ser/Thr protein kinase RdoA (MazF antagonist)